MPSKRSLALAIGVAAAAWVGASQARRIRRTGDDDTRRDPAPPADR